MASILRYPYEALLDTTDYLRVDLLSYDAVRSTGPGNLIRNSVAFDTTVTQPKKAKTLSSSIILPMPSNIQDGNSVSYADSSLDGLTAQVYNVVNDSITGGGRNGTLGSVMTLRSFKFSFKMTPRNPDEAKQIRAIIKTFKLNMAPKAQSDVFLKTPNLFQLSYRKGPEIHPYLNLFKQCFLTDMLVNYTGEGVYSTYSDGSPISYTMDLGFKELEPIYEGDYASNITPANSVGF